MAPIQASSCSSRDTERKQCSSVSSGGCRSETLEVSRREATGIAALTTSVDAEELAGVAQAWGHIFRSHGFTLAERRAAVYHRRRSRHASAKSSWTPTGEVHATSSRRQASHHPGAAPTRVDALRAGGPPRDHTAQHATLSSRGSRAARSHRRGCGKQSYPALEDQPRVASKKARAATDASLRASRRTTSVRAHAREHDL